MGIDARRLFGDGPLADYAGPRAFFKTVAHPVYPSGTDYPEAQDEPNVYRARKLKNVAFTEEPGRQTLTYDTTDQYAHIFNLEPLKYIEEGSVVLCFREGGRWYTIDKVVEEKPCCGNYMFRGAFGGGLQSFTLTMEALHGWAFYNALPTYTPPAWSQESLSSPVALTMTYEHPIPDAFLNGLQQEPGTAWFTPEVAAKGWYISPTVTFMAFPGDPLYSGTSEPATGRWFYGPDCRMGFWLSGDYVANQTRDGVLRDDFFMAYLFGLNTVQAPDSYFPAFVGTASSFHGSASGRKSYISGTTIYNPPLSAPPIAVRHLRGFDLFSFGGASCRPFYARTRDFWISHPPSFTNNPPVEWSNSPNWGIPAFGWRTPEDGFDPPNPLATAVNGVNGVPPLPLYMTPPPAMDPYRGVYSVYEYFCVQFTATA